MLKKLKQKRKDDIDYSKIEGLRLEARQKSIENRAKLLKDKLQEAMKKIGKPQFKTNLFSFNIAKNGGKQVLTIDGDVPEEYTKTIIENDTDKIRAELEEGKNLPFAHLEPRGESLRIK